MIKQRIYSNRIYLVKSRPGISGFVEFDKWEYRLINGMKLQRNKSWYEVVTCLDTVEISNNKHIKATNKYFLEDGHLPGHLPKVSLVDAYVWLIDNPFNTVFVEM
jgi:hypothetical protein